MIIITIAAVEVAIGCWKWSTSVFDSGAISNSIASSNSLTFSGVKSHLLSPPRPSACHVAMSRSVQNSDRKIGICTSIGRHPETGEVPCFLYSACVSRICASRDS